MHINIQHMIMCHIFSQREKQWPQSTSKTNRSFSELIIIIIIWRKKTEWKIMRREKNKLCFTLYCTFTVETRNCDDSIYFNRFSVFHFKWKPKSVNGLKWWIWFTLLPIFHLNFSFRKWLIWKLQEQISWTVFPLFCVVFCHNELQLTLY